ncbi:TPR-like protein [Peniophora sp. CONT]|nr:TPR-like protein [Peniophora sp. CONT]
MGDASTSTSPDQGPRELGDFMWTLYQYEAGPDTSFLDMAIQMTQIAVDIGDIETLSDYPPLLYNLGVRLRARYALGGDSEDLDRAISAIELAGHLTPDESPSQIEQLNELAISVMQRFQRGNSPDDLASAITAFSRAAELMPDSDPSKPNILNNLGIALRERFTSLGDTEDLLRSVAVLRRAVELTPDDDPSKPLKLSILGNSLVVLFGHTKDIRVLDQAVSAHASGIGLMPDSYPNEAMLFHNLGNSFFVRFEITESLNDLEEAIAARLRTVETTKDGHPDQLSRLSDLNYSLCARFARTDSLEDLDSAISACCRTLTLTPDDDPDKSSRLRALSILFLARVEQVGDLEDLERALSTHRSAAQLDPDDNRSTPTLFNVLGVRLVQRYERSHASEDLERAISVLRHAVELAPDGQKHRPLATLGDAHNLRFQRTGDAKDIEEAILAHDRAVRLGSSENRTEPEQWGRLSYLLMQGFFETKEPEYLERAISVQRRAVDLTPDGQSESTSSVLNNLALLFRLRFDYSGEAGDIEQSISTFRRAAEITSDHDPARPEYLNRLGGAFLASFERSGDRDHLEQAISSHRRAVALTIDGSPNQPSHFMDLGKSFATRFKSSGEPEDLEQAITAYRRAVDLTPISHPDKPSRLHRLGTLLYKRFERTGELVDTEETIYACRLAAELTLDDHPGKPVFLNNLGQAMLGRFERTGCIQDLEQAIKIQRLALELSLDDHSERPSFFSILGASLFARFKRFGEDRDLEEAVMLHDRTADLTPRSHPDKSVYLNHLGNALLTRFDRSGELMDLERAIAAYREAVDLSLDAPLRKAACLSNVGNSLSRRFERTTELEDLEQAIFAHRQSVELTPDGDPTKPSRLNCFGCALSWRSERSDDLRYVEQAVSVYRRAVELTSDDHPRKPIRLINLCQELRRRFDLAHERDDIETAISTGHLAIELSSAEGPPRELSMCYGILAICYQCRSESRAGSMDDIKTAISLFEKAMEGISDGDPRFSVIKNNMGCAQSELFERSQSATDFDAAIESFMQATLHSSGRPSIRFGSARRCARLLSENPSLRTTESLLLAHSHIIAILPEIVWLGYDIRRRFEESSRLGELVNAAVASAISAGALAQGLEWLEAGRALIWAQVSSLRTPLDELRSIHPDLADSLLGVQKRLQTSAPGSFASQSDTSAGLATNPVANQHRLLVIEHERLLKEIRACSGFEDFLLPKKYDSLIASCRPLDGPVVFVNMDPSRCDALILCPDGTLTSVSLPDLTLKRTRGLFRVWKSYLVEGMGRARGMLGASIYMRSHSNPSMLVLEKLWRWVVCPILESLDLAALTRNQCLPHITWCPTGLLAYLPLHAAGVYKDPFGPRVFDFVVSSYTPSLTALLRSANGISQHKGQTPTMLLVSQPATPGQTPLPGTAAEAAGLRRALAGSRIETAILDDQDATIAAVRAAISQHPWVHLACHGSQETVGDPTQSAFMLYDGRLSLSALMGTVSDNAELAFLSACQTAFGHLRNPEESAHLAAGMLAVGFKAVIGTTWSIRDDDAPVVVEAFYKELIALRGTGTLGVGKTGAAYALHEATKSLREMVGEDNFMRWVPFVHFGI